MVITTIVYITLFSSYDYRKEIRKRYKYNEVSSIETYEHDCRIEFKNNVKFPIDKPYYAKLHFARFLKPTKNLNKSQTETILKILNDTASYVWGELGTPYFDSHFTFHDKDGNCIGYTAFSFDGQTYSTPSLAKMKWGFLTDKARVILMETINLDKD